MKLYLYRRRTRPQTTDGVLRSENGMRICDTAEHTQTMLPEGRYKVRFMKYKGHRTPHLLSQEGEASTRGGWIVVGNGVHARRFGGNIIVGDRLVPGVVMHSRSYFERLVKRLEKAYRRGREVELVIMVNSH